MNTEPITLDDFKCLGRWLENAQIEFSDLSSTDIHTTEQAMHLSFFASLIARVIKIRADYLAKHNPIQT